MKIINTILNIVLLAGTCLLLLLVILSGASDNFPLNKFYWIKADTSLISGAPSNAAWTFWGVCEEKDFSKCTLGPAYPISPKDNFDTTSNVPKDFVDNRNTYYYLSRFSFAFALVAIGFAGIALIVDLLAFCFQIIDKVVVAFVSFALFFVAALAAFQTAVVVLARNAFNQEDMHPTVGLKLMAITWAAFVCILLVFFNTCFANISNSYKKHMNRVRESQGVNNTSGPVATHGDDSSFTRANAGPVDPETREADNGGIRFFKIKRNNQKISDDESI